MSLLFAGSFRHLVSTGRKEIDLAWFGSPCFLLNSEVLSLENLANERLEVEATTVCISTLLERLELLRKRRRVPHGVVFEG